MYFFNLTLSVFIKKINNYNKVLSNPWTFQNMHLFYLKGISRVLFTICRIDVYTSLSMFSFLFQTLCLKYDYTITNAFYNMMITRVLHAMVTRQGRENTWIPNFGLWKFVVFYIYNYRSSLYYQEPMWSRRHH